MTTTNFWQGERIRLYEKLGAVCEGRLRRMHYPQGKYLDMIYFGITAEEFAERYG
jgi:RimJ/RimL family protein N-acetyltransferase